MLTSEDTKLILQDIRFQLDNMAIIDVMNLVLYVILLQRNISKLKIKPIYIY